MARKNFRFQLPETLPQQSSGTVSQNCQQTVFFAADHAALYPAIRRRCNDRQHAGAGKFHAFAPHLIELRFEAQFILFPEAQAGFIAFRHDGDGHFTQRQAVSRARPF